MARLSRPALLALWLVSLVLTAVIASAQVRRDPAVIISGGDIGFRPDGWNGKARTGTWMVRVNGDWVEAQGSMKAVPATR